jgi:hypothetical protein
MMSSMIDCGENFNFRLSFCVSIPMLLTTFAAAGAPVTQCQSKEQVFFSCSVGRKMVSLCGSPMTGKIEKLVYRFGFPLKSENEFVASVDNGNHFFGTVSGAGPGAGVSQVWFDRGNYRYLMTSCVGGECPDEAALSVLVHGKIIQNLPCNDDLNRIGTFSTDLVEFGESPSLSKSKTSLLLIEEEDNPVEKIFVTPDVK